MLFLSRTVRRGERTLPCVVSLQDCEERGEDFALCCFSLGL